MRYLLIAGFGTSWLGRGLFSSAKRGVLENILRVRKSSGCVRGAEIVEKFFAALFSARRDAVRFDLKERRGRKP